MSSASSPGADSRPKWCSTSNRRTADSFTGAAPVAYCYDSRKKPFVSEIERGAKVDGFVIGIVFSEGEEDTLRVYLPDSNVYEISKNLIHKKENSARVTIQS